jgi:uracil-xanthine permease
MKIQETLKASWDNIRYVFKGTSAQDNLFKLDGRVPFHKGLLFGIQHVLAMFAANIVPIILVFSAMGLYNSDFGVKAILGCLFMAGIGTMAQLFIGARLPIVIGTSFTFVPIFLTIINDVLKAGGTAETAYYTIMGSVICGGLVIAVLALLYRYWGRLIKPIVPAVVVLGIGLSLLESGATQFVGGSNVLNNLDSLPVPYYAYILVAIATLATMILYSIFMKGVWKNLNIIVGILFGYLLACCIPGMIDFSSLKISSDALVGAHGIVSYPSFIDLSKVRFELMPCILVSITFLVGAVESIGDTSALASAGLGRKATTREISGALACDGFNSALGACFGSLPLTTFSQNVGVVAETKVVNRFTIFLGAGFLLLASFFPPIANFILTIPDCVIGGTMVMLFGSIGVIGMKMVGEAGWSEKNVTIVSLSLCLGFGLSISSTFISALNTMGANYLASLLSNPVLNMFVISLVLSWLLPDSMHISLQKKKKEEPSEPSLKAQDQDAEK